MTWGAQGIRNCSDQETGSLGTRETREVNLAGGWMPGSCLQSQVFKYQLTGWRHDSATPTGDGSRQPRQLRKNGAYYRGQFLFPLLSLLDHNYWAVDCIQSRVSAWNLPTSKLVLSGNTPYRHTYKSSLPVSLTSLNPVKLMPIVTITPHWKPWSSYQLWTDVWANLMKTCKA